MEKDLRLEISENSRRVLEKRYLNKDIDGKVIETPEGMFKRVAQNIAKADKNYAKRQGLEKTEDEFTSVMANLEFLPNSPTLMNAGKELQQLSACFVLPVRDSMEGIFDSLKSAALIHKCLTAGTLVSTEGGIKRLNKLKTGDRILADEGYFNVEGLYKNGKQIVYEVLTNRGFIIRGTSEHKLLAIHENGDFGWREIGELGEGDWIAMQPSKKLYGGDDKLPPFKYKAKTQLNSGCFKAQPIKLPGRLTAELGELIGIYVGDGSNHRDGIRFSVGGDDIEMVGVIKDLSKTLFDKKASISHKQDKGYEVSILSVVVKKWFEFLGVTKISSKKTRIPEIILSASEDIICAFLRGLFSTDGCIRKSGHITLTSASKILSEELQTLLFYVGIPTHRNYNSFTDSYQVSICTKEGFINFKQKIGFMLTRKNKRLVDVRADDIFKRGEIIPNQRILIKDWYRNLGNVEEKREARLFFDDIVNRPSEPREISRQRITAVLEKSKVCPQFLKTLLNKNYFFVRVSKVNPLGVMDTYDITVSERHRYLANGFITHNSGGGTGFSFSNLRPKNSVVKSTGGVASGPVSFMKVFDSATQAVKQGGCVRYDTIISTTKGLKPIKDMGDIEGKDYQNIYAKVPTDSGIKMAEQWYNNGIKPVKTIITTNGYEFTGTPDHKIRVIDENGRYVWKKLVDIQKDDWVALQKNTFTGERVRFPLFNEKFHFNTKLCSLPEEMSKDLAELIGYFIGDGCFHKGKLMLAIPHDCIDLKDHFDEIVWRKFKLKSRYEQKKNDKSVNNIYHSKMLVEWLKFIGVNKVESIQASIPKIILEGDRICAKAFLRGLFEADGTITKEGYITLYSISKDLIRQTQVLLLSLGIPTRLIVNTKRDFSFGKNCIYRLNISVPEGLKLFKEKIGFTSKKKTDKLSCIKQKPFTYNDIIPNQSKRFREFYETLMIKPRNSFYKKVYHYLSGVEDSRSLTRQRAQVLIAEYPFLEDSFLNEFLLNNQYYDQVKEMQDGKTLTLDLVVPDSHTYIANGFVSHNTRRGANMGILRVDHPDILEFITCKENNKDITNFNISVYVTDDFMNRVESGDMYDLIDPHSKKKTGELNAREVFNLVVKMAWKNGEPGIIFGDKLNKDNPTPKLGMIESTNPCVIGDTLVSTEKGLMKIKDLAEKYPDGGINIFTDDRVLDVIYGSGEESGGLALETKLGLSLNTISKAFKTGVKPVLKITTESGYELNVTYDHKIMTPKGWIKAGDLKIGEDTIFIQAGAGQFNLDNKLPFDVQNEYIGENGKTSKLNLPTKWSKELGQILGWLVGDGWLRDQDKNCRVGFTFSRNDKEILDYLKPIINNFYGFDIKEVVRENDVYHLSYHSKYFVEFFKKLGIKAWQSGQKEIPDSIYTASEETVIGFLQGLFSADGTVRDSRKSASDWVALCSKSKNLLKNVQMLLLNLGIKSAIFNRSRKPSIKFTYVDKAGRKKSYECDGILYELGIFGESLDKFRDEINFLQKEKVESLRNIRAKKRRSQKFTEIIKHIEHLGEKEVYNLTEPTTSSMIVNGIVTRQCGEQPLLPYESCNLGSVNLARMISDGKIDWDKLAGTVKTAVHFLDNVIDMNKFPLSIIREKTRENRKIGLGVMGFADMLIKLGIPYDSGMALETGEEIMKFMLETAKKASEELAETRGAFPNFDNSIYHLRKHKLRNATLTTIAPTGTLSIIANCSSGIEPIFAISYIRNVMDNDELVEVHPEFLKVAKKKGFYSEELMKRIANEGSIQNIDEIPDDVKKIFRISLDIDPEYHIKMQAAFQKYTNNAVSKTINFPNSASEEDVKKSYALAYKHGCKGITIYRDKSRDEQVLNIGKVNKESVTEETQEEAMRLKPRPRGVVTYGTTTKVSTGCGNLYVTINNDDLGQPFEVFMQMGKAGGCAMSQLEAIGRLVSLALRSGVNIDSMIDQLRGIRCPSPSWEKGGGRIFSCSDAIARVIERRIAQKEELTEEKKLEKEINSIDSSLTMEEDTQKTGTATKARTGSVVGVCPDCGAAIRHVEGCQVCTTCGYSKC